MIIILFLLKWARTWTTTMPRDNLSADERRELLELLERVSKQTTDGETRRRALWLAWWIGDRDPLATMRLAS